MSGKFGRVCRSDGTLDHDDRPAGPAPATGAGRHMKKGANVVMTDSGTPRTDDQADEVMLTTGEAAKVIGFGTTRKQVDAMIAAKRLAFFRPGRGAWARVPLAAALAKRRELAEKIAESEAEQLQRYEWDRQDRQGSPPDED